MRPRPGREYSAEYGILVDADLRHRRRAHVERVDFHAVDDDGDATVAERSRIEKARHRRDEVAIEHRQAVEHVLIDRHRVDVARRLSCSTSAAASLTVISCEIDGEVEHQLSATTAPACRRGHGPMPA